MHVKARNLRKNDVIIAPGRPGKWRITRVHGVDSDGDQVISAARLVPVGTPQVFYIPASADVIVIR
jgi:hypothetical protein